MCLHRVGAEWVLNCFFLLVFWLILASLLRVLVLIDAKAGFKQFSHLNFASVGLADGALYPHFKMKSF